MTTIETTAEGTDDLGRFSIVTRTIVTTPGEGEDSKEVIGVHRTMVVPGHWEDGEWVATDLSDQPSNIQDHAAAHWTGPVIAAYQAAFPAPEPIVPTAADVEAERARRLAQGFDFDFGDERGVHRIGTTPADMTGWDEVTTIANAMLLAGVDQPIMIETNGAAEPIAITASEWQQVLLAAAAFRQPIWLASFALAKMDPIPADYADDVYWSA